MTRVAACVGLVLLVLGVGCNDGWRKLGVPRVALEETSPDEAYVAQVRNAISIDPPNQSLWMAGRDGRGATRVLQLGGDQDWCNQIVWSGDGSTVAFLVQDAWIAVYDAESRRLRVRDWLVPRTGYPTIHEVRDLRLASDGTVASYRVCRRGVEDCSGMREFAIPVVNSAMSAGAG